MHSRLTPSRPIDIHNIEEGLDRKLLTQLKQRFMDLNQVRYARTYAALTDRQQQFFELLPLLFHLNHPQLPGYTSHNAPAGIYGYEPDEQTLRAAKKLARSINYNRDLTEKNYEIDAMFLMGSVGTIGQSDSSDLDIWVCHNLQHRPDALQELERKCALISQWAESTIHLEVHCFLMQSGDFSQRRALQLSSEGSGSAQHFLLLDEFYRTALWLAGKVPLWWFVPASQEKNYAQFCAELVGKRFIKQDDVVDFGALPVIPRAEFLGAGVWQLYKGIESPYKSVLKLLLLEAYASNDSELTDSSQLTDSHREPLALSFKREIYNSVPDADALDPYVMVYKRLESYLLAHQQLGRLELIRRCFYFKADKALSHPARNPTASWQRQLLEGLVKDWQWSAQQLQALDNRARWKSSKVIREHSLLVNELSHSYRWLTELHNRQGHNASISNDELLILGRKLHAAFERKAGKIEWINPGISKDMAEEHVCCVHEQRDGNESWQLLRGRAQDVNLHAADIEPIKRSRSLVELLLWCHTNKMLTKTTKIDVVGNGFSLSGLQKQQLLQTLQHWLPLSMGISHDQFTRPAVVEHLLFIINLGTEPQEELYRKGMQMLSNHKDVFMYGGLHENLVINADVIYVNSWGEILCRHYARDALVNCLQYYFRLFPPDKAANVKSGKLPVPDFRCFGSQGGAIAQRLKELWQDLTSCYYSGKQKSSSRYILEAGNEYLLLQFSHHQLQLNRFTTYEKLLEKLGQAQLNFSPITIDRYALLDKPLRLISNTIKSGSIYLFFKIDNQRVTITIADGKGSLISSHTEFRSQQTFLRPLMHFIQAALQRLHWDGDLINDSHSPNLIHIHEITGSDRNPQLSAPFRPLDLDLNQVRFINIKAIAEMEGNDLRFTIFCEEQEFSALTYGDDIFKAVANHIIQRRQHNERYPCYITDLDLSLCRDVLTQQTGLQLGHYLHIKADLENRLNLALASLG